MQTPVTTGSVVAGYRIELLLGEGAMGAVYLAEDTTTGRRVALKLLAPELGSDDRFRKRFLRESQVAASLDNPHVVATLASGEDAGLLYLAMPYIEGDDLRTILRREGALEPERALDLVAQVAEALDAAHDAGLVHRDVKPGNILVEKGDTSERAYLCDFGLARHVSSPSSLTGVRGFVGTIDYVPPEQIEGLELDRRSDVYSLSCVLFECLAEERPFERDSELAVVFAHLNEPPPSISPLRPELPAALDGVFAKGLAKSRDERYGSCAELVTAAEAALRGKPLGHRRRRLRVALGAAATVLATGAAFATIHLVGGGPHGFRPGTLLLDLRSGHRITSIPRSELQAPAFPLYSHGHFWLLDFARNAFIEIEPRTGEILRRIAAPAGSGTDGPVTYQPFAVGADALWLGSNDDLVKVRVSTGRIVERLRLDRLVVGVKGLTESVALGMGLVWVSRDAGVGQVIGIDPRTRRVRYRFDDVVHHDDIAISDGLVWTADFSGAMVLDPRAGTVTDLPDVRHTSRFAAGGGGYGWAADPAKGVVYKLGRDGGVSDTYRTGFGANNLSFSDGVVWVANEDEGTVSGIDAITGRQTSYSLGHPVPLQAVGGGVLLASLQPGRSVEDRIAALHGTVFRLLSQQGEFGTGDEAALNHDSAAYQIDFATCAKLLNYPDTSSAAAPRLYPEVAAALPSLSHDRRTYTFRVRSGYRFSPPSNEPVTAETFRYSIERALSPRLGRFQPAAAYVRDIVGEQAFREGEANHIGGLRANGDRLSITLTRPSPDFLERLALPFFCPVPRGTAIMPGAATEGGGPLAGGGSIPSAGPYYIASFINDKSLFLERNPNYHGPRPHAADVIALREGVDPGVEVERMQHGAWEGIVSSGHHAQGSPPFDPLLDPHGPLATRYGKSASTGLSYVAAPLPATAYIALDTTRGPFADPRVRRAVALAVDRSTLAVLDGDIVSGQLLPPRFPHAHDAKLSGIGADPAAAKKLLSGRRVEAVMAVRRDCGQCAQEAKALRSALGRVGIRVELKAYRDPLRAAAARGSRVDLLAAVTHLDYPDSASFLTRVFLEDVPPRWVQTRARRAVERLARLSGARRQTAAAALADRLVRSNVAVIPWGNPVQGELFSPRVGCRVFPPMGYGVDLAALCSRS